MCKKEKLIRKYFALKHEFDMNESCVKPCPAEPTEDDILSMQKEFRVMDLEYKINCVESALKNQAIRISRKEYFDTEEGKLAKENAENAKNILWNQHKKLVNDLTNWINNEICYLLGDNWLCNVNVGHNIIRVAIGMKNIHPEKSAGEFEFGHAFDITYDNDSYYNPEVHFTMSSASISSFDLFNDTYRSEYLEGMGRIANNKKLLKDMFGMMADTEKLNTEIENKINDIDHWLNNPINK